MKLLTTILFISLHLLVNAQTAYQGGDGDGYDVGSIVFQTTGVQGSTVIPLSVYPTLLRAGETIHIRTELKIQSC